MVVIPEIILQKAVVGGLQALKADPRMIDVLFKNVSQRMLADIKAYMLNTSIDWSVNYPRKEQLNVPAIVLILRGETEAQTFLGDHMGSSPENDTPDPDMMIDTLGGHGASISDLSGMEGPPVVQGLQIDTATATTITIADSSVDEYQPVFMAMLEGNTYLVYVVSGTGAGQIRTIANVSANSLDITAPLDVLLDSTSVIDIREISTTYTEGEPSRVFDSSSAYKRVGVHYSTQYQLQILAGHQDEVMYLYSIIKALLLSQRVFLEGQGIMVLKLSGSDFAPRGEYLPSDVFMRVLNLEFTYAFSVLEELEVATSFQVNINPNDLDCNNTVLIGPITIP